MPRQPRLKQTPIERRIEQIDQNTTIIDLRNSLKASKNSKPLGF